MVFVHYMLLSTMPPHFGTLVIRGCILQWTDQILGVFIGHFTRNWNYHFVSELMQGDRTSVSEPNFWAATVEYVMILAK